MNLFLQFFGVLKVFSKYNYEILKILSRLISFFELGVEVHIFFVEDL